MRILGLDPGSHHTGYGVVEQHGTELTTLGHGRLSSPRNAPLPQRLAFLAAGLDALLARYRPEVAALEALYRGVNNRSLIVLAQARGVLLARLAAAGPEIREYSPAEVKSAVTGNGRADKAQVERMVRLVLRLDAGLKVATDASDALAVAICYARRARLDELV